MKDEEMMKWKRVSVLRQEGEEEERQGPVEEDHQGNPDLAVEEEERAARRLQAMGQ